MNIKILNCNIYCIHALIQSDGCMAIHNEAYSIFEKSKLLQKLSPIPTFKAFRDKFGDNSHTRRHSLNENDSLPPPVAQVDPHSVDSDMATSGYITSKSNVISSLPVLSLDHCNNSPNTPASLHTALLSHTTGYVPSPILPAPSPDNMILVNSSISPLCVPSLSLTVQQTQPSPTPPNISFNTPSVSDKDAFPFKKPIASPNTRTNTSRTITARQSNCLLNEIRHFVAVPDLLAPLPAGPSFTPTLTNVKTSNLNRTRNQLRRIRRFWSVPPILEPFEDELNTPKSPSPPIVVTKELELPTNKLQTTTERQKSKLKRILKYVEVPTLLESLPIDAEPTVNCDSNLIDTRVQDDCGSLLFELVDSVSKTFDKPQPLLKKHSLNVTNSSVITSFTCNKEIVFPPSPSSVDFSEHVSDTYFDEKERHSSLSDRFSDDGFFSLEDTESISSRTESIDLYAPLVNVLTPASTCAGSVYDDLERDLLMSPLSSQENDDRLDTSTTDWNEEELPSGPSMPSLFQVLTEPQTTMTSNETEVSVEKHEKAWKRPPLYASKATGIQQPDPILLHKIASTTGSSKRSITTRLTVLNVPQRRSNSGANLKLVGSTLKRSSDKHVGVKYVIDHGTLKVSRSNKQIDTSLSTEHRFKTPVLSLKSSSTALTGLKKLLRPSLS